jgi:3-methyladenine DNA glycosylase AlkD
MQHYLAHILADLAPFASPARAMREKAYLKSRLQCLGVGIPRIRAATMAALKTLEEPQKINAEQLRDLALAAYATESHDARAIACVLLEKRAKQLSVADLPWLADLIHRSFTWAYVDQIAVHAVGSIVQREPQGAKVVLADWARDGDFWLRRSALLALLGEVRAGGAFDGELFEAWAVPLLGEKEFFIRKAIGWVLRDVAGKDPAFVREFLQRHAAQMSALSLKEARRGLERAEPVQAK